MQQIVFLTMITFQKDHTAWPSVPTLCLSFFVLQFLALAVFFFIEEPMRRLLTRKTTSHQAFGASPSASIGFSLQRPPAENSPL
jgi:peptidoglycan/LPS O-acetylase OafA/YrhL